MEASAPETRCAPRSPWYHASTRATTNPIPRTTVSARRANGGQAKAPASTLDTWSVSQAPAR